MFFSLSFFLFFDFRLLLLLVWKLVEDFQKSEVDRLVVVIISITRRGGFERESLDHLEEFGSVIGSTDMSSGLLFLLIARLLDKF